MEKWGQESSAGDGKSRFINPFQQDRRREGTGGLAHVGLSIPDSQTTPKSGISESFRINICTGKEQLLYITKITPEIPIFHSQITFP